MEIFFSGSITGGRADVEIYQGIVKHLSKHGEILNKHVADRDLDLGAIERRPANLIHDRSVKLLLKADIIVAETTVNSQGVIYEIARGVAAGKPILVLFRQNDKISPMIRGADGVTVKVYSDLKSAFKVIDDYFEKLYTSHA